MMNLTIGTLKVIAMLCQLRGDSAAWRIEILQAECHAYYAKCSIENRKPLATCMRDRKIK